MSSIRYWTGLGYNGNIDDPNNWTYFTDLNNNTCYYGDTWGDTLIIGEHDKPHAPNYLQINIYGELSVPVKKLQIKKTFKGDIGVVGRPLVVNLTGTHTPPSSEYVTSCNGSIVEIPDFKTFIQTSQESIDYNQNSDFDLIVKAPYWSAIDTDDMMNSIYKYYIAHVDIDLGNPHFDYQGGGSGQFGDFTFPPLSSSSSSMPSWSMRNVYIKVLDSVGNGYWNCKNRVMKSLNYITIQGLGNGILSTGQNWNTNVNFEGDIFHLNTSNYSGNVHINNCEVFNIYHYPDSNIIWHPTQDMTTLLTLNLRNNLDMINASQPVSDLDPYDAYGTGCVLNEILESNNELTTDGHSVGFLLGTNKTNIRSYNYTSRHMVYALLCGHFSNIDVRGKHHSFIIGNSQINGSLGFDNQIKIDNIYWESTWNDGYPWDNMGFSIETRAKVDFVTLNYGGAIRDNPLWGYPSISISREYETTIKQLLMKGGGVDLRIDSVVPAGINVDKILFDPAVAQENGVKLLGYTNIVNSPATNSWYWFIGDDRGAVDAWTNYHI